MFPRLIEAFLKIIQFLVDVFNGENGEPCITHKRTLIASITLRHALQVINKYAFKNNPYPIILTIENHVGLPQQKAMARIFHEVIYFYLFICFIYNVVDFFP